MFIRNSVFHFPLYKFSFRSVCSKGMWATLFQYCYIIGMAPLEPMGSGAYNELSGFCWSVANAFKILLDYCQSPYYQHYPFLKIPAYNILMCSGMHIELLLSECAVIQRKTFWSKADLYTLLMHNLPQILGS